MTKLAKKDEQQMSSRGKYRPLLGRCLIELETQYAAVEQGIHVPEEVLRQRGFIGTVVAETPSKGDPDGLVGQRVILGTSRGVMFDYYDKQYIVYPMRDILACIPHDVPCSVRRTGAYGIKRCRFCKSPSGPANMILDEDGICPQCGRNAKTGRKHQMHYYKAPDNVVWDEDKQKNVRVEGKTLKLRHPVTFSPEERAAYSGLPTPKIVKDTIFSFSGMKPGLNPS